MLKNLIGKEVEIRVKFVLSTCDGVSADSYFGIIKDVDDHFCKLELTTGKKYTSINAFQKITGGTLYININDIASVYAK